MQGLEIFGVKLDFNSKNGGAKYFEQPLVTTKSLKEYEIEFTQTAKNNISSLNITEDTVIQLVENEFTHHINYFLWDLLDYPLPVQLGY